jgi:hypothetical protein
LYSKENSLGFQIEKPEQQAEQLRIPGKKQQWNTCTFSSAPVQKNQPLISCKTASDYQTFDYKQYSLLRTRIMGITALGLI